MKVCEIFSSLLGESTRSGLPAVLVRLTGCNLRCRYCDTTYAFSGGEEIPLPAIVARVQAAGLNLVLVTGGEPLLQPDTPLLLKTLLDSGFAVLLETNGSFPLSGLDPRLVIILDQKCPGSGMADRMDPGNLDRLRPGDELKFVISDRADYQFARDLVEKRRLARLVPVIFSPASGVLPPKDLSGWILADRLPVRLGIQLHKCLGIK